MKGKATSQYLQRHAEPIARQLPRLHRRYECAVVLPCYDEPLVALTTLFDALSDQCALLILVLNEPDSRKDDAPTASSAAVLDWFNAQKRQKLSERQDELTLYQHGELGIMVVDHCKKQSRLPHEQGVGLARKIGTDIALALYAQGAITSPMAFSTDADVVLPKNYTRDALQCLGSHQTPETQIAAATVAFKHSHSTDEKLALAQALYDQRLEYYQAALEYAGSPYAFQTVGSALIINLQHYAKVRGFPKRSAGEDFYLLNKLAKTGRVVQLQTPCIEITTRISHRTPYGTGTAVADIKAMKNPREDYLYYHPRIFSELKRVLAGLGNLAYTSEKATEKATERAQEELIPGISSACKESLEAIGFYKKLPQLLKNASTSEGRLKNLHEWLDAFRTLRFVHELRDRAWPSVAEAALLVEWQNLNPDQEQAAQFPCWCGNAISQ